jgi:hypothetical protein
MSPNCVAFFFELIPALRCNLSFRKRFFLAGKGASGGRSFRARINSLPKSRGFPLQSGLKNNKI